MLASRIALSAVLSVVLLGSAHPYDALRWRLVGPFRGGRTVAVTGVPSQPGVFYMAPTDGGIWKSTDYARTWMPVFDGARTGSIGALAVAPGNAQILYAGSGEGLRRPDLSVGDGVYRSGDGGKTWRHVGLPDAQQINGLAVDPRDPNRVFAAVMGHPYGANAQRGLYRSTDGGTTWHKVLGNDRDTGASSVVIDPNNPQVIYANLWASRNPPWRLADILQLYDRGGIFKSTDGGTTWTPLRGGLPKAMGRAGIAVSNADSRRVYAWVNTDGACGIYRSMDAGQSWTKVNGESRICGRGDDFSGIAVDPTDPQVVYVANTTTYRSTDGGKTWIGIKGAPGGDDYHTVWIDPGNHNVILLGSDQGATLSVNYGQTWSSWYNQPTAQFYHVITDDRFPYRIFGGQQESGSAEILSRSEDGSISDRDWHPIGAQEYAYIAPDPLHPSIIYGAGAGTVTRYDERTLQAQVVSPVYGGRFFVRGFRYNRTNPLIFNHIDKRTLYLGSNLVFASATGGASWRIISPDLTRAHPGVPVSLGAFSRASGASEQRGVVYSIGPSYVNGNVIWAGTDDGLVWVTRDRGGHWRNVTPPGLTAWSKITQIDPSHYSDATAYISVSRMRLDDMRPYIYRTHDGGAHWALITAGLPADAPVNAVREDPVRPGLLFAATERTVDVSLNDGASWEPLTQNLPATSVRDIVVHGDDLVAGTHGRSFWVLDDIAPLRANFNAQTTAFFKPATAYRLRRSNWPDTPLPPEEPAGQNPADGAVLDYYLASPASRVRIVIYDAAGTLVRSYDSNAAPVPVDPEITVPLYWVRPWTAPGTQAGMHRFLWDYRYADPAAVSHDYPISAIPHDTPRSPQGVLALPGRYTVKVIADGKSYVQQLTLRADPRIRLAPGALRAQFELAWRIARLMNRTARPAAANKRYAALNGRLAALLDVVEGADAAPTPQVRREVDALQRTIER
ncbi:MAG TPA: hypothetical protein VFE17_12845 [Candidatus Baltobacteraceae bacterium]|jgi:photosystem II stability/assembly factor-like uncharacterized protein|nr:hypothetical protein [Candidatus Baltobacteraceae bacterium]